MNQPQATEIRRPARLNALTGLRFFAALNILFFHFSNPENFNFHFYIPVPFLPRPYSFEILLAPVVNAGYVSVSYFILLSGFVLGYNYAPRARAGQLDTARFYKARITRLYPIYFLSLLLAWWMIPSEYAAHSHGMFWTGIVLTPLLLQGWIPSIATFLNTPAWTMSAEALYYTLFPWMAKWKRPEKLWHHIRNLGAVWLVGMIPGLLYMIFSPDSISHPDRWSYGPWLQALKYTPYAHICSFVFGVLLAELNEVVTQEGKLRLFLGLFGFLGIYGLLLLGPLVPYAIIHDGLLMPLFACIVLGLAGNNWLSRALGIRPLTFIGEASYCLYLLHFNLWTLVHSCGILQKTGLIRFDPWISYVALVSLALFCLHFIEKPVQRKMREWMNVWK
ncbi:MAG: acyltransferase [Terracidiphilus sp.]|nr:acyltransferase [Terracidiphilus sp.]